MNSEIHPIKDAWGKVIDFVVKHECEACKQRRQKVKAFLNRRKRDALRNPRSR
ncbi:MAG: hypothetical protein QG672_1640 [Pseudomonadota bacterium]|jgi:hypothetical protein|nr:hypothetical protein [Pseudomonadota bacterium]